MIINAIGIITKVNNIMSVSIAKLEQRVAMLTSRYFVCGLQVAVLKYNDHSNNWVYAVFFGHNQYSVF